MFDRNEKGGELIGGLAQTWPVACAVVVVLFFSLHLLKEQRVQMAELLAAEWRPISRLYNSLRLGSN